MMFSMGRVNYDCLVDQVLFNNNKTTDWLTDHDDEDDDDDDDLSYEHTGMRE